MNTPMTAIEMTGIVDEKNRLKLDGSLPFSGPKRVRVIILSTPEDDIDEATWLYAMSQNSAFSFLAEPDEDIYTLDDGRAVDDKI